MRIANGSFITEGTLTDLAATITSTPVYLGHIVNYSIQLVFTGSPNGTFKLQASNDEGNPSQSGANQYDGVVNWTDVTNSSNSIVAAGNLLYDVSNAGYAWVRVVYTKSSGSGTLTVANFNLKGV